jgi:hypothetical protein
MDGERDPSTPGGQQLAHMHPFRGNTNINNQHPQMILLAQQQMIFNFSATRASRRYGPSAGPIFHLKLAVCRTAKILPRR